MELRGPRAGQVLLLRRVSIQFLYFFFCNRVHMLGEVPHQGGLSFMEFYVMHLKNQEVKLLC